MSDLLLAVEGELAMRNYGDEVRLEIDSNCPADTVAFLMMRFGMPADRLFLVDEPVNLSRIQEIYRLIDRPELKFLPFSPSTPPALQRTKNYFDSIRKQDILLHHPYQSFSPIIQFLSGKRAADPDVLAIKQTLSAPAPIHP